MSKLFLYLASRVFLVELWGGTGHFGMYGMVWYDTVLNTSCHHYLKVITVTYHMYSVFPCRYQPYATRLPTVQVLSGWLHGCQVLYLLPAVLPGNDTQFT